MNYCSRLSSVVDEYHPQQMIFSHSSWYSATVDDNHLQQLIIGRHRWYIVCSRWIHSAAADESWKKFSYVPISCPGRIFSLGARPFCFKSAMLSTEHWAIEVGFCEICRTKTHHNLWNFIRFCFFVLCCVLDLIGMIFVDLREYSKQPRALCYSKQLDTELFMNYKENCLWSFEENSKLHSWDSDVSMSFQSFMVTLASRTQFILFTSPHFSRLLQRT